MASIEYCKYILSKNGRETITSIFVDEHYYTKVEFYQVVNKILDHGKNVIKRKSQKYDVILFDVLQRHCNREIMFAGLESDDRMNRFFIKNDMAFREIYLRWKQNPSVHWGSASDDLFEILCNCLIIMTNTFICITNKEKKVCFHTTEIDSIILN